MQVIDRYNIAYSYILVHIQAVPFNPTIGSTNSLIHFRTGLLRPPPPRRVRDPPAQNGKTDNFSVEAVK